ncbi:MAG: fasciclin domain-containing protein [Nocardioidaceae bacterium]
MRTMKRIAAATAVVSALTLTAACGGSDSSSGGASSSDTASSAAPSAPESSASAPESSAAADPAADLVGKGCAGYAKAVPDGSGSVAGMAADPVAVAAGNNPILKTLTAAVSGKVNPKVNLVDTLNGGEFTVFAPVDDAFAKLPKATLKLLGTPKGAATLTKVLTYHVIPNQMLPDEIAGQSLKSVEGDTVKITGSGDNLKANGANVICGGVHTANATVYLIDQVMMPKS